MKALIVDDEAAAVIAVRLLVDWKCFGVDTIYEVNASEDVLPLVRSEEIQLIISDVRMPGMSGLDLITEVHKIRPLTKIIIMSGFGQFDYVRSALQQGCVDYILKPIDEKQINAAVKKALDEWRRDISLQAIEHSYREINSRLEKKQAQRLLLVCLNSANQAVAFAQLRELMPGLAETRYFRIGCIYTVHLPEEAFREEDDVSALSDMVHEMACATGRALAITRRVNRNILIFFDAELPDLREHAKQMLGVLRQKTGIRFRMGLSDRHPIEEPFQVAADEARERVRRGLWTGETPDLLEEDGVQVRFDLEADEEPLHRAVLSGHDSNIRSGVKQLVRKLMNGPVTLELLEGMRSEYLNMRIRWIEGFRLSQKERKRWKDSPEADFPMPFDRQGEYDVCLLEETLIRDLRVLADFFRDTMSGGEGDTQIFRQIEQYLLMNYTQKLSLARIAENFAVSESYLSHSFKKNIGMGITEYINQLRIGKAKELLLNPQMRIAEIAFAVGYADEKYFSRVFRKQIGESPQQYRLRHLGQEDI